VLPNGVNPLRTLFDESPVRTPASSSSRYRRDPAADVDPVRPAGEMHVGDRQHHHRHSGLGEVGQYVLAVGRIQTRQRGHVPQRDLATQAGPAGPLRDVLRQPEPGSVSSSAKSAWMSTGTLNWSARPKTRSMCRRLSSTDSSL